MVPDNLLNLLNIGLYVVAGLAFSIGWGMFAYKQISQQVIMYFVEKRSVKQHPLFSELKVFIGVSIPQIHTQFPEKTSDIRKHLTIRMEEGLKFLEELVEGADFARVYSPDDIRERLLEYSKTCDQLSAGAGVSPLFIERYTDWHLPRTAALLLSLSEVWENDNFRLKIKFWSTCDQLLVNARMILFSAISIPQQFNGVLDEYYRSLEHA